MKNQPQIDITKTSPVLNLDGTPLLLMEGMVLRKASKFLMGTSEDSLIPIPVMYNVANNEILLDMFPKELRKEYEENGFYLKK